MMVLRFRVVLRDGMTDDEDYFAAPSPSKRMMAPRFRVVLRGGMADDGGNFAAPSPSKRMMVLRFRVVLLAEWRMMGVTLLHHRHQNE